MTAKTCRFDSARERLPGFMPMAHDQSFLVGLFRDKLDKRILTLIALRQDADRAREEGFMTTNPELEIRA